MFTEQIDVQEGVDGMASQTRRFAVAADIHGNLPGLNAVLEDAKSRNISEFIFAGDY